MSVVTAQALHKTFGSHIILDSVDLAIQPRERVGLVGINGSGKSTLARIVAGFEAPDAGNVAFCKGIEVAFLPQEPDFPDHLTARQVVESGLHAWSQAKNRHAQILASLAASHGDLKSLLEQQHHAEAEIERLGGWQLSHVVDSLLGHLGIARPDAEVGSLSGGERRRAALAKVLIGRADLTVLDEPTNHLDASTVEWLENYLIDEHPGALLLITHDRYLLDRVAERTLEIDRGSVFSYPGGYEAYLGAKAERLALVARSEANRQNFLRRELEWLRRQPKARTTKQKARIERAEAARNVRAPTTDKVASLAISETRSGKTILELHGLTVEFAAQCLIQNLDLFLTQGERVGIIGPNGAGKTTLLKVITGSLPPKSGTVCLGRNTQISFLDQERAALDESATVFDCVAEGLNVIEIGGQSMEPRAWLERFLFDGSKLRQPVGSLSGGERARVALARMLRQPANLVILDEPTNDLDVATLGALEELLLDFGGTALVVTHDRWFLDRVATAILSFEGNGRVVLYPGNYTTWRRLKQEEASRAKADAEQAVPIQPARPSRPPAPKPKAGLTFAERKELETILDEIEAAEQQVAQLEAKLADPSTYATNGDGVRGMVEQAAEARARVGRLTARWEDLEGKKGRA